VFAEHGVHGSNAAPIARHVIETYFAKKTGQPLPVFPVPAEPANPVTPTPAPGRPGGH
jgi:hypothetical protein